MTHNVWQKVRDKLALDYAMPGTMAEQTHNPMPESVATETPEVADVATSQKELGDVKKIYQDLQNKNRKKSNLV